MTTKPTSPNVTNACSACGGGPHGFVKHTDPVDGHAPWCPTHNPQSREAWVRDANDARYGLPRLPDQRTLGHGGPNGRQHP